MTEIMDQSSQNNTIGQRILIIGNSCSGKSTLGGTLASELNIPFVELDALNWEPNWVGLNDTNPEEFIKRIQKSTAGNSWVVAGSYSRFSQQVFWPKLETVVWLDLPVFQLSWRMFKRSWRRWRTKELLWGTNYERFWPQLMVWRKEDSLLWWIVTQYRSKQQKMLEYHTNPKWRHIRFIRLRSSTEINEFLRVVAGNGDQSEESSANKALKQGRA